MILVATDPEQVRRLEEQRRRFYASRTSAADPHPEHPFPSGYMASAHLVAWRLPSGLYHVEVCRNSPAPAGPVGLAEMARLCADAVATGDGWSHGPQGRAAAGAEPAGRRFDLEDRPAPPGPAAPAGENSVELEAGAPLRGAREAPDPPAVRRGRRPDLHGAWEPVPDLHELLEEATAAQESGRRGAPEGPPFAVGERVRYVNFVAGYLIGHLVVTEVGPGFVEASASPRHSRRRHRFRPDGRATWSTSLRIEREAREAPAPRQRGDEDGILPEGF